MFLRISITILGLLILATGVRMYELAGIGLNEDEQITLFIINGYEVKGHHDFEIKTELPDTFTRDDIRKQKGYSRVVNASIAHNGNSIGYHVLLSWWTRVFGNTNYSVRFLTLLFGVLTVILGYYFARQLFNERTAVMAAVLMSLHPLLIEFGQLARAYVPATFLVLLSTYSLYQVAVSKRHLWLHIPLYVVAVIITALFHYLVIYALAAHVILVLFFHSHKKAMIQYSLMALAMASIFALWWFNGGAVGKSHNDAEIQMASDNIQPIWNGKLGLHIFDNGVQIFGDTTAAIFEARWIHGLLLILPGIFLYFAFERIRKSEYFRQAMFVLFPILMYLVFILVGMYVMPHDQVFDVHYTCFALPFACILLGFGFDRMLAHGGALKVLAFPAFVGLVFVMLVSAFPAMLSRTTTESRFPYHRAADLIESRKDVSTSIRFGDKKDALLTNFYINQQVNTQQHIDSTLSKDELQILQGDEIIDRYSFKEH